VQQLGKDDVSVAEVTGALKLDVLIRPNIDLPSSGRQISPRWPLITPMLEQGNAKFS
jgi:hypothetical protein